MNSRFLLRLHGLVEDLADQIQKRKAWYLAGFSILYLAVTCLVAAHRPLWNDELYTLYIARLPAMSDVWDALSTGAEQLPPFFYVLTRASVALFGAHELSLRLPEILGFWVMGLCLFRFVSERIPAPYACLAMLFPLVTGAYYYASEARPYGLVLGFSGLGLLSWQAATDRDGRRLWLVGLAVSLAAAVSSHYHAIFVLVPLAFAEAVRSLTLRRLDLPVWAALGLGVAPLLGFLPLIERAMGYSTTFWSKARWTSIPEFYYFLLAPAVLPLMALLVLAAAYPMTRHSPRPDPRGAPGPRPHEMVAVLGFMAIPAIAVAFSMWVTGAYTDRYALPAVIGCSVIVAVAAHRSLRDRPAAAVILTLSVCGFFLSLGVKSLTGLVAVREANTRSVEFLRSDGMTDLPIAVSDQHAFISLAHYAPRDIASRLVYLADPGKALQHLGHNSVEKGALALLKPWFRLRIEEYGPFLASGRRFLVYGDSRHFLNWLLPDLIVSRRRLELRGRHKEALLLLVSPETAIVHPEASDEADSNPMRR